MSLQNGKKIPARFQIVDPTIESLQERLLKSLNSAFDPHANVKSDDYFLAQDYTRTASVPTLESDALKEIKNPYKDLAQRAKDHIERAKLEKPVRAKTSGTVGKKSDTFLTGVGLEGNRRSKVEIVPVEEYEEADSLPPVSYDDMLGDFRNPKKEDDLEELRRMIRKTNKEMHDYGVELLSLKDNVLGINDGASRFGYGASSDLLMNIENTVNHLNDNYNEFKHVNGKSNGVKPTKPSKPSTAAVDENTRRTGKIGTGNKLGGGPANFIVSKNKTGLRAATTKTSIRKFM